MLIINHPCEVEQDKSTGMENTHFELFVHIPGQQEYTLSLS